MILRRLTIEPRSRRGAMSRSMQHAVDPVADPDPVGERLDVDVGGPHRARLPG